MNGEIQTVLVKLSNRLRARAQGVGRPGFYDTDARQAGRLAVQEAMEEVADVIDCLLAEDTP